MNDRYGSETDRCEQAYRTCLLAHCNAPCPCVIYGLYDVRTNAIFYVGKTLTMPRRFQDHLRDHHYAQAMLERGLFPLPVILCEFTTWCDNYSREIEHDMWFNNLFVLIGTFMALAQAR